MSKRITLSASKPATKLIEYAQRLSPRDMYYLVRRVVRGERLIVFNVDGDRVSLAEVEQREMVAA